MTTKTAQNPWTMDVRVRERNLKSGALTDKDVEKFLAQLPDMEGQSESFGTAQPALAQPHVAASSSAADESDEDMGDDDSSDDVGGDDGGGSDGGGES